MKLAYFDCFSGISGDMILGALLDAGVEIESLQRVVSKLKLPGCALLKSRVRRGGLVGTKVDLMNRKKLPPFKTFLQIERQIQKSDLSAGIKTVSLKIFKRMEKAEARAHGRKAGHLHEVGEIDTLVDVVGSIAGLSLLKIDRVISSPIHVGSGTVATEAGSFPVPAPATSRLLEGYPIYATDLQGELTTPTGAAIITTLAAAFSPLPAMTLEKVAWGAGAADRKTPNLLRLFIGAQNEEYAEDEIFQIETNIDDMNPQLYEHVMERLFIAGAHDVFITPIIMKRGRPAVLLTVLVSPASLEGIAKTLFTETTTLGIRIQKVGRKKLEREISRRNTRYGPIRVKTALKNGRSVRERPEFRDVRRIAKREGRPLHALWEEINRTL